MTRPSAVWVTGLGAVSAAGLGAASLGDLLLQGRTGVRPIPRLACMPAGEGETPPRHPAGRHLDRSARFFLHAAEEAWWDAGLDEARLDLARCAVLEGSSLGPLADLLDDHSAQLSSSGHGRPLPSRVVRYMTGAGGAAFAQLHQVRGPVFHLSAGSVSAACAIAEGVAKIRQARWTSLWPAARSARSIPMFWPASRQQEYWDPVIRAMLRADPSIGAERGRCSARAAGS